MRAMSLFTPAVLGLMLAPPALAQNNAYLSADMFGRYVPAGGSENATGDFNGEVDLARSRICYYLEVDDLEGADGAGIYQGAEKENGASVVALSLPLDDDEVCVPVDKDLLQAISQTPGNYYIAVRSPAHPNGAIRGQFGK